MSSPTKGTAMNPPTTRGFTPARIVALALIGVLVETIDELRADLRNRLHMVKRAQALMAIQEKTATALAGLVDDEIPEPLINSEMQNRLQDLAMRLQAQGLSIDDWLAASGKEGQDLVDELKETSAQ